MEVPSKDKETNNVSYRHLFTFGEETHDSPFSNDRERHTSKQFTFLGSGVDLFHASKKASEVNAEPLENLKGDHHLMSEVPQIQVDVPQEQQLVTRPNHIEDERKDQDGGQDLKDFNFPMAIERSQNEGYEDIAYMPEPEYGQSCEEGPSYRLPDDIFSRPEILKELASNFVRSLDLEQLEEEWERVDGVRDQMRRDFKIRRQKAVASLKTKHRSEKRSLERVMEEMANAIEPEQAAACCDDLRILACDYEDDLIKLRPSVEHCIKLMHAHALEIKVQRYATLALMVLCEKHKMTEFMGQKGVVPLVVRALTNFCRDQALVKNAVLLTRSLLLAESNRSRFCEHGGFGALSTAMTAFPDRESIQCSASALIATICYGSESRRLLAFANGILPLLVDSLVRFQAPEHWKVQSNVCMALRNLSLESAVCKGILSQNGFLQAIGNIIKPKSNAVAVEEALGVCLNIVTAPSSEYLEMLDNASQFLVGCVMEFLVSTVSSFRSKSKCHEMGFALLRACEALSPERDRSDEKGETEKMRLAILYATAYISNRSSSSVNVVSSSCLLIRTMVIESTNRRLFGELDRGVAILVRSIAFLSHSPVHVEHSLLALGNAVFDSLAGKLKACEWGALRHIANAIKRNNANAAVAEAGLMAIHGLCIESEKVGNLASSLKFHDLCAETMSAFETSPTVQERGLAALLSMGHGRQAKKRLHASNAMQAAERAADLYPYSKNILALRAKLESIASSDNERLADLRAAVSHRSVGRETLETHRILRDSETHHAQPKQSTRESVSIRILNKLPSLHKTRSKSE